MKEHSKILEDTTLWKTYQEKVSPGSERSQWVKRIYKFAVTYLKDVRKTFENYTLHDEAHVLNVLDAMGGLIGNRVTDLTVGELELLILAASLHDLGMVYTEEEKELCYEDKGACREFLKEHCAEMLGRPAREWTKDTRQWYLRTRHPFRLWEVLGNKAWSGLIDERPGEIVSLRCMIAVCQAHGEDPEELRVNRNLEYQQASDVDPLFCALLLRLADLLDFDDTRAPEVLYGYVTDNEESRREWDKHRASAGFRYPEVPSADDLPYKARCTNPGIEHAVRDFLDWIDDELVNCGKLQRYCKVGWRQDFPFPRAILRSEIESDGYMSGDFCLTMNQEQILKLLTGEKLYGNPDVFVRELLQNAIDATLLRGELDSDFVPEESRIDFWEWSDKEGNFWFRIDDRGTGMTLGMLQRYFLKVGNSYYTSRELERDLRERGQTKIYRGISQFGIGFLSCFLCGDYVEVSTLYCNPEKNRREEQSAGYVQADYGLRLQITGLTGYYTLKNQARNHGVDRSLPFPDCFDAGLERRGYRREPGTSIVIRLNPGKMGAMDLRETAEKYLCGARVPVYYNNKRIGRTYQEIMQAAHEAAGERLYELPSELKKEFDEFFPNVRGNYPKVKVTTVPLDTEENQALPGLSGVLMKYEVIFEQEPKWKVKDLTYGINAQIKVETGIPKIHLKCIRHNGKSSAQVQLWPLLTGKYDREKIAALEKELERLPVCPQRGEQLKEAELLLQDNIELSEIWQTYYAFRENAYWTMDILAADCGCPNIRLMSSNNQFAGSACVYHGVITNLGYLGGDEQGTGCNGIFFLEGDWKPALTISRSDILDLPLKALVAISGIVNKHQMLSVLWGFQLIYGKSGNNLLREWREIRNSQLGEWLEVNQEKFFTETKQQLQQPLSKERALKHGMPLPINRFGKDFILDAYTMAYLQDSYQMTISYEKGQRILFEEKSETESVFDIFPPMMFCRAAGEGDRQFVCHEDSRYRRGITADHPFVAWLLANSVQLNTYFQRQLQQIIDCLCEKNAEAIIQECNAIREQLLSLTERHGVDMKSCPKLGRDDFWRESKTRECPL